MQAEAINTTRETDEENHTAGSAFMYGQTTGRSASYTTSYNPPSCKLKVEQDMPTQFNTIYTGYFNGHSPLWGYPDHNATGRIIEDMLTAGNLILLYYCIADPLVRRAHQT